MADYSGRRDRLKQLVRAVDGNGILVTCPTNVTYLTGFSGRDSHLLVRCDGTQTLISDPRYEQQILEQCSGLDAFIRTPAVPLLAASVRIVRQSNLQNLAIESDSLTLAQFDLMVDSFSKTRKGAPTLIRSRGLVEKLREIKDTEEIASIRRAIEMAERAFLAVKASLHADQSEKQIADDLDRFIRQLGGKGSAFDTIVGVGDRSALPHGQPSSRKLSEAPFVLIDWGANEGLYLSDLTRVLATSRIPPKFERIYGIVLQAQEAAIAKIRSGTAMEVVDAAARAVITKAGFGKRFTHGTGHGFGIQIHESVRLAKKQDRVLEPNMIVTVEPGIYFPDWGGVRIEDDFLVTKNGCERLSSLPRELDNNTVSLL